MKKKIITLSIIFFITFGLLMGAYSLYVRSEILDSKNIYQYIAKDKADHISTTVNNVILRAGIMNALIQDHNGGTEFFNAMADDIYKEVYNEAGIELQYIAVAPDGIISDIYPYEGNIPCTFCPETRFPSKRKAIPPRTLKNGRRTHKISV